MSGDPRFGGNHSMICQPGHPRFGRQPRIYQQYSVYREAVAHQCPRQQVNGRVQGSKQQQQGSITEGRAANTTICQLVRKPGQHQRQEEAEAADARDVTHHPRFGRRPEHEVDRDSAE